MMRSPTLDKSTSSSDTNLLKRRRLLGEEFEELTAFKIEMRELFRSFEDKQDRKFDLLSRHLEEVKDQTSQINHSNRDIEKSLEFLSEQLSSMQYKIDGLEDQRKELVTQITNIEEKYELLEKNSKKTCIEIKYVPRPENETKEVLYGYMSNLASTLGITLQAGDLRDVYRLPNKREPKKPTIIAELSNTLVKNKLLSSARKLGKDKRLNVSSLGIQNDNSTIYISEFLTAKTRRLHFLAREYAKAENYLYCWTSGGNVYLKKKEGATYILVKHEEQLKRTQPEMS